MMLLVLQAALDGVKICWRAHHAAVASCASASEPGAGAMTASGCCMLCKDSHTLGKYDAACAAGVSLWSQIHWLAHHLAVARRVSVKE